MSWVFHPAIAMYCNASADSVALNLVVAPISLALSVNFLMSSPVAPLIACTLDIPASNFIPTLAEASPTPATAVVVSKKVLFIVDNPCCAFLLNSPIPFSAPLVSIFVSIMIRPSAIFSPPSMI